MPTNPIGNLGPPRSDELDSESKTDFLINDFLSRTINEDADILGMIGKVEKLRTQNEKVLVDSDERVQETVG
jgi:hypothetical protein